MHPSTRAFHYFPALTGLRAVAAYLVFTHHALIDTFKGVPFLQTIAREGHMGVTIFFVLSGYLIGVRYSHTFTALNSARVKDFLVHRFARLYPVYLLSTLVALFFHQDFRLPSWVLNLTMLQGFFEEFSFTGVKVGWSLTTEVTFYLAAPLLLFYWHRLTLPGVVGCILLMGGAIAFIGNNLLPFNFIPDANFFFRTTFFGRCFEFCLGIWLARFFLIWAALPAAKKSRRFGWFTYLGIAGTIGCISLFAHLAALTASWQNLVFHGLNNVFLPGFLVALLWGLTTEKTWVSWLLGSRVGQELGKGSYIFYLGHFSFGFEVVYFHVWQSRLGVLLLLPLFSVAGYHLVEAPLQRWLLRAWEKHRLNFNDHRRFT